MPSVKARVLTVVASTCALAMIGGATASAATATANMSVTATVQATCNMSATSLAFGTYTSVQVDTPSTLSVSCTNTTPYTIALNAGTYSGATTSTRQMTLAGGGASLPYALYRDTARTQNWGAVTNTDTQAGTGSGGAFTHTIYGRISAGQLPTPGSYADTIVATLSY